MGDFVKKNKWTLVVTSILILLPIVAGVILWDKLPEQIPFHWGVNGEVEVFSKIRAMFLPSYRRWGMPAFFLALNSAARSMRPSISAGEKSSSLRKCF